MPQSWRILPVPEVRDDPDGFKEATRLNSLGSLFFFTYSVLKKKRLRTIHFHLCQSMMREDLHLVMEVPMGMFKALDVRTPIPTPAGFSLMGHLQVGDTVFGSNGLPVKVRGTSPLYFSSECYEVEFSSGEKITCDAGHLWETQSLVDYNNSKPKTYRSVVRTTIEIAQKIDYGAQRNHRVKIAKPVQLAERDLPIPPYVLGCWLGDGTSSAASITIGKEDEWLAEEIKREGEFLRKSNAPLRWLFSKGRGGSQSNESRFLGRLRSLGVLKNKHVPSIYLRASASQRLAILQGLMDTDGSAAKDGTCSFSNTNKQLAEDVRELLCSLGLKPSRVRTYKERLDGEYVGLFHVVTFTSYADYPPFRLPRKRERLRDRTKQSLQSFRHIVAVRKVKPRYVKCIMVDSPDSLYLAGKGFIPTHNTTLGIALSIWWALPFDDDDEAHMRMLGYGDEWIRYMRAVHDPNTKTLITHEIEQRAIDMGKEVDHAYQDNELFRHIFAEVIPDGNSTWNDHAKFQKRDGTRQADPTTGTFTYRGVGQALQGVHPLSTIQDDNMGRAAQYSMLRGDGRVLDDLIRWHRQLTTRLDTSEANETKLGRQLVIGNRWGHNDLNSWIKANQPHFRFETHDAEGGCCHLHPIHGEPIFPEEWPMERLLRTQHDIGSYDYAHMYRNQTVLPEECIFKPEWLRYFEYKQSRPDLADTDMRNILLIEHRVVDDKPIEDLQPGSLTMRMIIDINHAKKTKRCDHCIWVIGYDPEYLRIYLMSLWAEATGYTELVDKMYETANRWEHWRRGSNFIWLETVGAQNILKFHIEERNRREKYPLIINELPYDNSENAKKNRIEGLEPFFRHGQIWTHPSHKKFIQQYTSYPAGLVDCLDALGYFTKIVEVVNSQAVGEFLIKQQEDFAARGAGQAGY
jgi:LAGLIDADG DNA endonuclease family protein